MAHNVYGGKWRPTSRYSWAMPDADWRKYRAYLESIKMTQRTYTIEIVVDFADNDKHVMVKPIMQQLAQTAFANVALLQDGVLPKIAIYSDDFYSGHENFKLIEDKIAVGNKQLADAGDTTVAEGPSQEMLDALK